MKRTIATLAIALAATLTAVAPAQADDAVCTTGELQEQVDCLRALHTQDATTIAVQTDTIAGLRYSLSAQVDTTNIWKGVAAQEEEQITRLNEDIKALHYQVAFWMDKAFKRYATILMLRARIRELKALV